ncbi:MAG: hypothetical protein Kow0089_23260 [Desulfobulbaceae bacterium]
MNSFRTVVLAAAAVMLVYAAGCKSNNEQASAPATQPVQVQQQAQSAPVAPALEKPAIKGKILETMDASGYTYVNVETETGPVWAAMPQTKVEVGQEIALAGGMEMQNFESKTLGRTFDSVIFSSGIITEGGAPATIAGTAAPAEGDSFAEAIKGEAAMETVQPMASSGGSQAAITPAEDVKVDKAEGENAYTVGELHEKKAELDKQKVRVRGKVVKFSPMIMGKNWIHLQDGSGDQAAKTHDLVVTTQAQAEKGAVVEVEGTLAADRDFGSGYRYDVIVEDAEVK